MFEPVFDSRKQKIRGLQRRGDRYYARIRMTGSDGKSRPQRIALGKLTLDEARAELERARVDNRRGELAAPARAPGFSEFADEYLASAIHGAKRAGTRKAERLNLGYWKAHLGAIPLDKIAPPRVKGYLERRLSHGVKARTVNIELIAFYAVMKLARDRGLVRSFERVPRLRQKPAPRRALLSPVEVEALLAACQPEATKNADLLRCYLRFLALTGAREKETLQIRWEDVDFDREFVTIGAGDPEDTKSGYARSVNFTPELEALLREMAENYRQPDSSFLFPSPQRGERDIPARSLRESLRQIRGRAGLPEIGFHDLRHFFASQCVMAGVDFMTISAWLGHADGGVLVGKVYGHLADAHKRRVAQNLSILKAPANVLPASFVAGA
jgi:integrase